MNAPRLRSVLSLAGTLTLALLPIWFALGNHPLHARSEARYARVAQQMVHAGADLNAWLVPTYNGGAHLTKPPLTYWLMAGSMVLFGENELALRMPAALAGSATVLAVLLIGRRLYGPRGGIAAAAVLSVMPMFVVVGRLGITDALLGLCYIGTLAAGWRLAESHRANRSAPHPGRWGLTLWVCVAAGLLNKGPLALLPAALVLLWFVMSRQWSALKAMRPVLGFGLATLPALAWVTAVWLRHPDAGDVWWYEIVDRARGTGDHPQAWWYLLPVFVVGLFPAIVLWALPGVHRPWVVTRNAIRRGAPEVLWAFGLLAPLILFTAFSGKLMSYLMPAAPCAALLAGAALRVWLESREREAYPQPTWAGRPGSIGAVALITVGFAMASWVLTRVVEVAAVTHYLEPWVVWPASAWALLSVTAWWIWRQHDHRRKTAAVLLWVSGVGMYLGAAVLETKIFGRDSTPGLVRGVRELTGYDTPKMLTVGYGDASLAFYTGRDTDRVDPRFTVDEWAALDRNELVLIAEPDLWRAFHATNPALLDTRYERLGEGKHAAAGGDDTVWVFTIRPGPRASSGAATAPPR